MLLPVIVGAVGLLGTAVEAAPRGSWFSSVLALITYTYKHILTIYSLRNNLELLDM
jgi:hypothetical protein